MAAQLSAQVSTLNPQDIILVHNNQLRTTSRFVASAFGKRHDDVLRKLKGLECSEDFTARNFAASKYQDSTGRNLPEWEMTKDGFMFLVMGFTGKKAAAIKEAYIEAFNWMADRLEGQDDQLKGVPHIVYRNEPVLTFEMVDQLHGRKHGHTSKSYYRDLKRGLLQKGVHYFKVPLSDREQIEAAGLTLHHGGLIVLTQDGYEQIAGHYTEPGAEQTRQRVLAGYFNQGASDAPTDAQLRALREAAQLLGLWVDIQRTASNEEKITRLNRWRDAVHALFEHGELLGDMLKTQRHTEAESLLISRLQLEAVKVDDATYVSNMLNQQLKEIGWAKRHRLLGYQQ